MVAICGIMLILLSPVVSSNDPHKRDMSAQIFDGMDASHGQFPFIGSLRNAYDKHVCGATLITSDTAVTAAHCFDLEPEDDPDIFPNLVVFGDVELERATTSHHHSSFARAIHYDYIYTENDIALIYLKSPIIEVLERNISSIPIARTSDEIIEYSDCLVIGWGETREYSISNALQYTSLKLYDNYECEVIFGAIDEETTLCAGSNTSDACPGDSGGPLACYREGNVASIELVGVVSFGREECQGGYPGVYTRVSAYQDWIDSRPTPNHATISSSLTSLLISMVLSSSCFLTK